VRGNGHGLLQVLPEEAEEYYKASEPGYAFSSRYLKGKPPNKYYTLNFFVVKSTAADATDAPQPSGLLCNPVMKMIKMISFSV
jgi:hypothetical protein